MDPGSKELVAAAVWVEALVRGGTESAAVAANPSGAKEELAVAVVAVGWSTGVGKPTGNP